MTGLEGTFWIMTSEKKDLLLQRNTAFEPTWQVARYSPESEKSIDKGALLKTTQSIRAPVRISNTFKDLSRDETKSHLLSG